MSDAIIAALADCAAAARALRAARKAAGVTRISKAETTRTARLALVVQTFRPGDTPGLLAQAMGLDAGTMRNDFRRLGWLFGKTRTQSRPRGPRHSRNSERTADIVKAALIDGAPTLEVLGQQFGLSRERIRQILKTEGVTNDRARARKAQK